MELYFGVNGPDTAMSFKERAIWAWTLQKEVARITGITKWSPAFKRKLEIESEEVYPILLAESKSSFNRKSIKVVRHAKIPDDMIYEHSSTLSFYGPFSISYTGGVAPESQFAKWCRKSVSVRVLEEHKCSSESLLEVFRYMILAIDASEATLSNNRYNEFFKGKVNIRVPDGEREKIVRYMWTGLLTFLPKALNADFDLREYNHTHMANGGVIISMEGVEDVNLIMDFNRKVAALYGTIID